MGVARRRVVVRGGGLDGKVGGQSKPNSLVLVRMCAYIVMIRHVHIRTWKFQAKKKVYHLLLNNTLLHENKVRPPHEDIHALFVVFELSDLFMYRIENVDSFLS